jgi:hypothetical protein
VITEVSIGKVSMKHVRITGKKWANAAAERKLEQSGI